MFTLVFNITVLASCNVKLPSYFLGYFDIFEIKYLCAHTEAAASHLP